MFKNNLYNEESIIIIGSGGDTDVARLLIFESENINLFVGNYYLYLRFI